MSDFIDLGAKSEPIGSLKPSKTPKVHYPSLYVSGIEGLDGVEDGDEVTIKGTVTSCTSTSRDGKTTYSCEIEARELSPEDSTDSEDGGDGLDSALSDIQKKKADQSGEEDDTNDTPADEADEGE